MDPLQIVASKRPFTFFFDADKAEEYIALLNEAIRYINRPIEGYPGFFNSDSRTIGEWNAFLKTLETKSANGIVNLGAIESKQGPQWIVKTDIASNADPIMYEYYIGRQLNHLRQFVPNFALTFGGFQCAVMLYDRTDATANQVVREYNNNESYRPKRMDDFCSPSSGFLWDQREMKQYTITEKVTPGTSLHQYARRATLEELAFALEQVLCALQFAQEQMQFTHYDLHSQNVIMQELPNPVVMLYNLSGDESDVNRVVAVPAKALWVMIDYGRSHLANTPERVERLWRTHQEYQWFTDMGIDPLRFNPIYDAVRIALTALNANTWELRSRNIADTIRNTLQQCVINPQADTVRADCNNTQLQTPLDFITLIESVGGLTQNRLRRVREGTKFLWYGYPASDEFKNRVQEHLGIRRRTTTTLPPSLSPLRTDRMRQSEMRRSRESRESREPERRLRQNEREPESARETIILNAPITEPIFDFLLAEEVPLQEFLNDDVDNVAFYIVNNAGEFSGGFGYNRNQLKQSFDEGNDFFWECKADAKGIIKQKDVKRRYFLLRGTSQHYILSRVFRNDVLRGDGRIFALRVTQQTLTRTTNDNNIAVRLRGSPPLPFNRKGEPINYVSTDHCQPGTNKTVTQLLRVVILPSPAQSEAAQLLTEFETQAAKEAQIAADEEFARALEQQEGQEYARLLEQRRREEEERRAQEEEQRRRAEEEEQRRLNVLAMKYLVRDSKQEAEANRQARELEDMLRYLEGLEERTTTLSGGGGKDAVYSNTMSPMPPVTSQKEDVLCLYIDGRMLTREDVIDVLKQQGWFYPELAKLTDNQLCVFLNDRLV
jgi:hypothetical protein